MGVQEKCEVILDEVLAGDARVDGVPVVELSPQVFQGSTGDSGGFWEWCISENMIPHLTNKEILRCKLLRYLESSKHN